MTTTRRKTGAEFGGPGTAARAFTRALAALLFCALTPVLSTAGGFDRSSAGTASVQSLKIAASARGAALGEAFSALTDDASALDWNPAGMIKVRKLSVSFMHSPYLAGSYLDFFSYVQTAGDAGSWGMAGKYMNYGSIKKTDVSGVQTGGFTPYDMTLNVGFATYITGFNKDPEERFVLGATGKFVRSQILNADNTVSADIGILFPYLFDNRFQMAMTAQNIMGTLRYDRYEYSLPLILRFGTASKISDHFIMTADLIASRDNIPFLAMGGELKTVFSKNTDLFLRGGFNTRGIMELNGLRNISFGAGFRQGHYSLDYSFSPFGTLGSVNRLSAGYNF